VLKGESLADGGVVDALVGETPDAVAAEDAAPAPPTWSYDVVDCDKRFGSTTKGNDTLWAVRDYPGRKKEDLARVVVMICAVPPTNDILPAWAQCQVQPPGATIYVKDETIAVACGNTGSPAPLAVKFILPAP